MGGRDRRLEKGHERWPPKRSDTRSQEAPWKAAGWAIMISVLGGASTTLGGELCDPLTCHMVEEIVSTKWVVGSVSY